MVNQIWKMSAVEVHRLLKEKKLSAREVLESSISRIEEVDNKLNALPEKCFDRARKIAERIDNNPPKGIRNLHGLPIAIKDYNDISGVKTTYGSLLFKDNVPKDSDRTVRKLEDNGANCVAKSNVPEWAGGHTFNPVYGLTRNPWDTSKSSGGSSGGSSAALASGQVFLATGNDLGGSLRTPAAFNGVVGLRPSPGLIPRGKRYMPFDTLWVEGPMARSVEDVALMLDAMVGHDIGDPLSYPCIENSFLEELDTEYKPLSVAVSEDLGIVPVEGEVRNAFRAAIRKISGFGWDVTHEIPSFEGVLDAFKVLRGLLMATMLGDLVKKHRDQILVDIRKNVQVGFEVKNTEIVEAEKVRRQLTLNMENFFIRNDFLICPTTSVFPFSVENPYVKEIEGKKCETYVDWFSITFAITMTSCPTLSIPCGFTESGLPIGIQIVAPPRHEARLLSFGARLQEIFGVARKLPISPQANPSLGP